MIALWLFFRAMRWLAWISFFGTAFYCMAYRPMTPFGHLQLRFEVALMLLGNACFPRSHGIDDAREGGDFQAGVGAACPTSG